MNFTILEASMMKADLIETWRQLQDSNSDLSSPFFCPEFTLVVASARDDVRVAIIEDRGSIAGFFPFEVNHSGFGKPVGAGLSDYQGIICSPGFQCDALELVRACGLIAWDFDHLVAAEQCFLKFQRRIRSSPLIDLTRGFDAYKQERSAAGSDLFKEIARKARLVEREVGKLRFVAKSSDDSVFRSVLSWKSAQLARMKVADISARPWVLNTLNSIRTAYFPAFAGMLSVLYAGDTPIAGHFGMRSKTVWHWWLTAYAPEYSRYSPGSILLYKMAEAAASEGIRVIDLGKGQARYKERFKNGEALVAEGSVERGFLLKFVRKIGRVIRPMVENTALAKPARHLLSQSRLRGLGELFK
jgi:CelD/BcsL family acetyltransferase involved in cellulose biosynthesis